MSILIFIIILGVLILVHEFGHFLVAKRSGVLVEEFGFGFPPRLFGIKIGETLYSINLIPLGGFVKLYGEEYQELQNRNLKLKNRTFAYKKPSKKALIIVGGVLMNVVLAIFLYYITIPLNNFTSEPLPRITPYHFRFGEQENKVVIGSVVVNSPASKSGIEGGDFALRVGKKENNNSVKWYTLNTPDQFIEIVKNSQNIKIYLEIQNISNGVTKIITVIPKYNNQLKRAIIGINLVEATVIHYQTFPQKLLVGFLNSYNLTAFNIKTISYLISQSFIKKSIQPVAEGSSGPVGIFQIIDQTVHSSGKKLTFNLLNLLALLSISLAIINILPFPALDGGRLVFVIYEWITKKPVNQKVESVLNLAGFVVLLTLAGLVTINDIMKIYR